MLGAIIGDMVGSPYEFSRKEITKDFPLFSARSHFTDDSVMTIAVAEALLNVDNWEESTVTTAVIASMRRWGHLYPHAGYGGMFRKWLKMPHPQPYNSYGNGSAMRVAVVGWLFEDLDSTRRVARYTAEVTHNHSEGIKGAEAVATAIYLARHGYAKDDIADYMVREFSYDLSLSREEIALCERNVEICQQTVPEALIAFLQGENFEDVLRTAVSFGGDTDTLACIAGSIAEAFYGIPDELCAECLRRLPPGMQEVLKDFQATVAKRKEKREDSLKDNVVIEYAISSAGKNDGAYMAHFVLLSILARAVAGGSFVLPIMIDPDKERISMGGVEGPEGTRWNIAFTSYDEYYKGRPSTTAVVKIMAILRDTLASAVDGVIINPWDEAFFLDRNDIKKLLKMYEEMVQ